MRNTLTRTDWRDAVLCALLWLFWLQAARVLFSVLFGVIYDALFAGGLGWQTWIGGGLLLPAFLLPLVHARRHRRAWTKWGAIAAAVARVPLTLNNPGLRLVSALILVGGAGLFLGAMMGANRRTAIGTLVAALCLDQILRALGQSLDITLTDGWLLVQVLVSSLLVWLAWPSGRRWGGTRRLSSAAGLALGATLFLELNLLAIPAAIAARAAMSGSWEWVTVWLTPATLLVTILPWLPWMDRPIAALLRRGMLRGLALVMLVAALLPVGQGLLTAIAYLLAQLLLIISVKHLAEQPAAGRLSGRNLALSGGATWALGAAVLLAGNFAFAFALTYPYALPFMRGTGVAILGVAGVLAGLPYLRRGKPLPWALAKHSGWLAWGVPGAALILVTGAVWPAAVTSPGQQGVRVATYNIHYGYDTFWHMSLPAQADAIAAADADAVFLQEVDAGRLTGYHIDDAGWLARRLGMHAVYAPTVEGVTGIGLLSRYPVASVATELLPSDLEQTAIIRATLDLGNGEQVDAYATWLGLSVEERAQQVAAALAFMGTGDRPAVFGGDLNSEPDSPTYAALAAAGWIDSASASGFPASPTDPAIEPVKRIDYVWWRGPWHVTGVTVSDHLASDHRLVVAEARLAR